MKVKTKELMEKKWMQYLIAALILLVGAAASLLILTKPWETEKTETTQLCMVTFYDATGKLWRTHEVHSGSHVIPVPFEQEGYMFKGWDKDLYTVTEDLEVYPVCEAISDAKNIVYVDTVYADTEYVLSVTPKLSGTVDCSGFTIEMGYDDELLHFEGAGPILDGLTVENADGVVTMTWSADAAIAEETDIAILYFKCKKDSSYSTTLPFLTKEIVTLQQGEQIYTDSTAYDGKLYLYQN